jgi:hypothetical protein
MVCGLLFLAGCRANPLPTPVGTQAQAYPSPTSQGPVEAYPAPPTPDPAAIPLVLDRPLKVGATVVTGGGPAGLVIGIINVTLMGEELGSGIIGPDNRFSVSVPALEASTRIGLAVNDTGSTGRELSDYYTNDYKGPGALMVPQVGYFQDSDMVKP